MTISKCCSNNNFYVILLQSVGVSAANGQGISEFFQAIDELRIEYIKLVVHLVVTYLSMCEHVFSLQVVNLFTCEINGQQNHLLSAVKGLTFLFV